MPPTRSTAAVDPLQEGARETLERIAAEKDAKADPPSGIEVGIDLNWLTRDDFEPRHYLEAHNLKKDPEMAYRWISTDPARAAKRFSQGWSPIKGGQVRMGDLMLSHRPEAISAKVREVNRQRQLLMSQGTTNTLERETLSQGGIPFDGSKSLKDGM